MTSMGAWLASSRARAGLAGGGGAGDDEEGQSLVFLDMWAARTSVPAIGGFQVPGNIQGKRSGRHYWMTSGKIPGVRSPRADR